MNHYSVAPAKRGLFLITCNGTPLRLTAWKSEMAAWTYVNEKLRR